jgi:hypothetical protein
MATGTSGAGSKETGGVTADVVSCVWAPQKSFSVLVSFW